MTKSYSSNLIFVVDEQLLSLKINQIHLCEQHLLAPKSKFHPLFISLQQMGVST